MSIPVTGLVCSTYPNALDPAKTSNGAPLTADVFRKLGGGNRLLYELVTGRSADSSGAAASPKNGQNTTGIDHTGAPWGSAVRHPLAVWAPSGWSSSLWDRSDYKTVVQASSITLDGVVDVRGHPQYEGSPYSRGYWFLVVDSDTASTPVTFTDELSGRETTITQGTTETHWDLDDDGSADAFYQDLTPGRNRVRISMRTSHATAVVTFAGACFAQVAKRVHTRVAS